MRPVVALLTLFLSLLPAPAAVVADDGARDLADLLGPIRNRHEVPALAAGVVRDGKIVAVGAVGVRRADKDVPVSLDDKWHVGSCAMSMTATLAAVLVRDGKIGWDSTVPGVLGGDGPIADGWEQITLRDLIMHRGGAPADLPDFVYATRGQDVQRSRRMLVDRLLRKPPTEPGKFVYSDAGYVIAGRMMEAAAGETWERLLYRRIFDPLGIKSAGFGAPGLPGSLDQPRGHRARDGFPMEPLPWSDNPLAIGPAGTVHLSIRDWLKFLDAHVRGGAAAVKRGHRIDPFKLSADTMQTLHSGAPTDLPGEDRHYGYGWALSPSPYLGGNFAMTHEGSNTLWHAIAWASPRSGAAAVVVVNRGGDAAEAACREALDALLREQFAAKGRD